jgi:hypothetical protein
VVRKDGHVRFRGKYYSLNEEHVGKSVFIVGTPHTVEIFIQGKLLETHPRITNPHQSKSTKKLHLKKSEQEITEHEIYLERAQKLGANVLEIVKTILGRGNGFVDFRAIWGILNLDKDYSSAALDEGCRQALESEKIGYRAVLNFLKAVPREEKNIERSTGNKYLRDPDEYKQMGLLN